MGNKRLPGFLFSGDACHNDPCRDVWCLIHQPKFPEDPTMRTPTEIVNDFELNYLRKLRGKKSGLPLYIVQ